MSLSAAFVEAAYDTVKISMVKLIPEAFNIGGDDDQAPYIEDSFLPEPPEAPPAVDNAVSFSMDLEDSFLPEPPQAPPELQGADDYDALVLNAGPLVKTGARVLGDHGQKTIDYAGPLATTGEHVLCDHGQNTVDYDGRADVDYDALFDLQDLWR